MNDAHWTGDEWRWHMRSDSAASIQVIEPSSARPETAAARVVPIGFAPPAEAAAATPRRYPAEDTTNQ